MYIHTFLTGVGTTASNSITNNIISLNFKAHWMLSLSGVSVTSAPVQPQSTSTSAGSLFAGLSFNDNVFPILVPSLSLNSMTSAHFLSHLKV